MPQGKAKRTRRIAGLGRYRDVVCGSTERMAPSEAEADNLQLYLASTPVWSIASRADLESG